MIHINSKTSPSQSTLTMCNRRHKGMMQTSIILVLCACIGYGFYLHNLLQMKLKYIDSKAVRYQSQQKSLSSQLQVVYEDRSRLEKAVQKSKSDLTKTKEEYEDETKKKDELLQQMMLEHNDKYTALKEQYDLHKAKSEDAMYDMRQTKMKHDNLLRDHEKLKKEHEELKENHSVKVQEISELQRSHQEESENMKLQQSRLILQVRENMNKVNTVLAKKQQVFDAKKVVEKELKRKIEDMDMLQNAFKMQYQSLNEHKEKEKQLKSLQYLLKAVPVDAIDLNHPSLKQMPENDKSILLDQLGPKSQLAVVPIQNLAVNNPDPAGNAGQIQLKDSVKSWEEHNNVKQNINDVNGNLSDNGNLSNHHEEEAKRDVDQDQLPQQQVVDICASKPLAGPCLESQVRYHYHPELKRCIRFDYSGCGGNRNNFLTPEICEDTCNDPAKRFIAMPISEEDQIDILANQKYQENKNEEQLGDNQGLDHGAEVPKQEEGKDEDENELVHVNQEGNYNNHRDENDNDLGVDNQNAENINPIDQDINEGKDANPGEDKQSEEERLAQEEEERIQQREEEADADMVAADKHNSQLKGDTDLDQIHDVDSKSEIDEARDQQIDNFNDNGIDNDNQQNQINAQIQDDPDHVDEEGDDYNDGENREGEIDGKDEEEDPNQVDMPPAAQVAGKEPEVVMNRPPGVNDDNLHMEDENQEDEYEDENYNDPDKQNNQRAGNENNVQLIDRGHDDNVPLDYDHGNRDNDANLREEDGNESYNDEDEDQEDPAALRLLQDDRVRKDQKFIQMENVQRMKDQSLNFHRDI